MTIKGSIHCLFEQSGTFKNEFCKLGYKAYDYDIQNNYGETDYQIDLFDEIEKAYRGEASMFDTIMKDDLIMAFFPCIYFTGSVNPCYFRLDNNNYRNLSTTEKFDLIIERANNRNHFYILLFKLCSIAILRDLRLIIENPFSPLHFLHDNFLKEPSLIDRDRTRRGDYFVKPTGYWYFNCEPTHGFTYCPSESIKKVWGCKPAKNKGLCSEERSIISPTYAHNFICDNILGITPQTKQLQLFN